MPPQQEYEACLKGIWDRGWITNNGPLVQKLEQKLKNYLRLNNILYVSNGTIALQFAIRVLGLKGEIITTPFTYIATTSSIVWENCKPVFVDIDSETLNIDPEKIEKAFTSNTKAILATHCFGNPCDVEAIDQIAKKHNVKVIYDASHCFDTRYKGKSIFLWGDISTTSFHATKLFHTVEGGAVFTKDNELLSRMSYLRNFGHDGPEKFNGLGINGKNSEMHAAMGICNFKY
ncbi:MAG: DegT/DnrJ/EryC1/StrS family aminotransferase, partial [Balneolales bacterium]